MKRNRFRIVLELTQFIMWACVFLITPAIYLILLGDVNGMFWTLRILARQFFPLFAVYLLNYYLFIPKLVFKDKQWAFYLANIVCLILNLIKFLSNSSFVNTIPDQLERDIPDKVLSVGFTGYVVFMLIFQIMVTLLAMGLRYAIKWNDEKQKMEEERRHHAEAELDWLKSQLNPHFLFNTLNNISSLTQTDADRAQESISQLSGLLRYALYESKGQLVRIAEDIGFMENYIDLMSLRCSSATKVSKRFDVADRNGLIAPLLFISLIENAFKHGTSSHNQSFVSVEMFPEGDTLVFRCSNSLLEKPKTADYRGSGIGVENTRRRLELIYPDSHSYEQTIDNQIYTVTVKLFHTLKPCAE